MTAKIQAEPTPCGRRINYLIKAPTAEAVQRAIEELTRDCLQSEFINPRMMDGQAFSVGYVSRKSPS